MNDLTYSKTYDIRSYEIDQEGKATLTALCNQLQDAATRHAAARGFGYTDLIRSRRIWVLSRFFLRMDEMPSFGRSVTVRTWPSEIHNALAYRDFLIQADNEVIGRGTSAWAVIDLDTRKAVDVADVLEKRFIPEKERALEFEGRAVKRIREGAHEARLTARFSDQDLNQHVNSIRQVELLLESAPQEWLRERRCVGGDVQFRAESHAGEELRSLCTPLDENTALHILVRISDDREVARMKTWWGQ